MENTDWKRYLLFLTIIFAVFVAYDYFTSSNLTQNKSRNQTEVAHKQPQPNPTVDVNLYLGSEREKLTPKHFITVEGKDLKLQIAQEGAKIVSAYDKKFKKELIEGYEKAYNIYPLEILTPSWETTKLINFSRYQCEKENLKVVCQLNKDQISVKKVFTFDQSGYLSKVSIEIKGVKDAYLYIGMTPNEDPFYTHIGPIFKFSNGEVLRINPDDLKGATSFHGDIIWSGEEGRYFIKAVKYNTHTAVVFPVSYLHNGETQYVTATAVKIKPTAQVTFLSSPKEYEILKNVNFVEAIDFGVLSFLAYPTFLVLYFFYKIFHSWVAAIFILTLILKLIFFPLMISSTRSMKKMQELAPKLEELRKKYANDPQRLQQEIVKLYKETGFNPFGGCLPILVQIPIFFALYKVLIVTPDLALEGFLWIPSLAEKDPFYILPILMGLTMVAQSFIAPSPNKGQNTVMYLMAAVFTFLFATFPSGLVLYWTLNNILSILQTWVVYRYLS
ncbi:MAG TPA: membrane protein insertase YidC [Aquifex aeolicus]|uniref:Membrane protein insertase YidC n=1 Tax=Aquifex aeolicus TaxID=63363 RepID=A0A9D0YN10_AQUAO|nr:membrane protein insertase YidC [Aquifex aeolicus]